MLVIYHSYGGTGALAAAALHLGRAPAAVLQERREPVVEPDLLPAPIGRGGGPGLHLQGHDPAGHAVYALSRNVPPGVIDRAFLGVASVFKLPATAYLLVDAAVPGERSTFWLAWLLMRLGRPAWARRMMAGRVPWHRLAATVQHTKRRLATLAGAVR